MSDLKSKVESAFAAIREGDIVKASSIAREILAVRPNDPNALQALGVACWRQGDLIGARAAFERALSAAPDHPPILNSIGVVHRQAGDFESSRRVLEKAVTVQPGFVEAWRNLGATLAAMGADASPAYDRAASLDPGNVEILASFATYLEARHELARAREMADRALTRDPSNAQALSALASIEARENAPERAIELLDKALANAAPPPTSRAVLHGKRARLHEKLSRFAESFSDSMAANTLMENLHGAAMRGAVGPRSPATLARLEAFARDAPLSLWTRVELPSGPSPAFLVGFPRSGTTMLDQILSTFDDVCVMEEKECIADLWTEILLSPDGLQRWPQMGPSDVRRLRDAYWRRAQPHVQETASLVIDKLPLDTALLGLIHFIFPEAKIIFALRDPRDVVLSCFQQTFGMNAAMYQFLDLRRSAEYYDQIMRLGGIWREKLQLDLHEVVYEKVIADFDDEIGALLGFLGLPWSDDLRRFHETARKRKINTPSASQVIEPLYGSAVGKWRNYESEMSPVRPILDPWAKRFGYDV